MARQTADERVTMREGAKRLGMTEAAFGQWSAKPGAPVVLEAGRRWARWPEFPIWYRGELQKGRERPADFEEAKTRKMQAEAELAELTLEEKRGEVVGVGVFREEVQRVVQTVRAQLLAVPGRMAPRTAGVASLADSQQAWDAAIRDVLRELQRGDRSL